MKKKLLLTTASLMIALSLAACGGKITSAIADNEVVSAEEEAKKETSETKENASLETKSEESVVNNANSSSYSEEPAENDETVRTDIARISDLPAGLLLCNDKLTVGEFGEVNVVSYWKQGEHRLPEITTYLTDDDEILYELPHSGEDYEGDDRVYPCLYDVDKDGTEELVLFTYYYLGAGEYGCIPRPYILAYKIGNDGIAYMEKDVYDEIAFDLFEEVEAYLNLERDTEYGLD